MTDSANSPAPRFEASDLVWLDVPDLEERRDWDLAYLVVGDEGALENGVTVLGHAAGVNRDRDWTQQPLNVDCGEATDRTDDAEAIAGFDGWIYLVGSHYGSKRGPLKAKRQWIARIAESALGDAIATQSPDVAADVRLDKFRLHRAVNDAVRDRGLELIRRDERITVAFINAAREEGKDWADRLHDDDWPLNIEAAAFRSNGNLLIGLRFPVCADGSPLAVELEGVTQSFEGNTDPAVAAVWQLDGPGSPEEPVGFRAMVADGADGFDAILGSLDAEGKDSLVIECHPGGATAHSQHWRFELPDSHDGGLVTARPGKHFDVQGIEGLAHGPGGQFASVIDDPRRIAIQFFAD